MYLKYQIQFFIIKVMIIEKSFNWGFDSGLGADSLERDHLRLPEYDYIYLGDNVVHLMDAALKPLQIHLQAVNWLF